MEPLLRSFVFWVDGVDGNAFYILMISYNHI